MNNEKFLNCYRIPSARAKWHGYDGGAYFVTVCTANREPYFGTINDGQLHLTVVGQCVESNLQNAAKHYPYAEIPLFVIMPNHLHAVVIIDGDKIPRTRREVENADKDAGRDAARHVSTTGKNAKMQQIAGQSGWLSVTIGGIKSSVTKFAHENHSGFAWQSRFHDHIIRDTNEMNHIADYIENNIARWESDCFYNNKQCPL